jgi:hypothetical protein
MAKNVKKVDPKAVAKVEVMTLVKDAIVAAGFVVLDGTEFGMTAGTLVIRHGTCDIQIKPIAPKTGIDRYEVAEVEAE